MIKIFGRMYAIAAFPLLLLEAQTNNGPVQLHAYWAQSSLSLQSSFALRVGRDRVTKSTHITSQNWRN